MRHNHFGGRLTIGCPACIDRVKLDQDVAAAASGEIPPRSPIHGRDQIAAVVRAWVTQWEEHGIAIDDEPDDDQLWSLVVVRCIEWCDQFIESADLDWMLDQAERAFKKRRKAIAT